MTVCVLPNPRKVNGQVIACEAARLLTQHGARVVSVLREPGVNLVPGSEPLPLEEAFSQADVLLTVGGDGTILHAAKESLTFEKPILGINLGRTGFLATCEPEEMPHKLAALVRGEYSLDSRLMLEAEGVGPDGPWKQTALNDVVIYRVDPLHTIDCSVWCDNILVNHCRGDGVIVASPTGSTAYSMSAGGPILDAEVEGIVVTPICAHSLRTPPMVFSAQRTITLQVVSQGQEACVTSDGSYQIELKPGSQVKIHKSRQRMQLVTFNQADQFHAIDRKLKGR